MTEQEEILRRKIAAQQGFDPNDYIYEGSLEGYNVQPQEEAIPEKKPGILDRIFAYDKPIVTAPMLSKEELEPYVGSTLAPYAAGAQHIVSGFAQDMTRPSNVALAAASGGTSMLGAGTARTLLNTAVRGGLGAMTYSGAKQLYEQAPQIKEDVLSGDPTRVTEAVLGTTLGATMLPLAAYGAYKGIPLKGSGTPNSIPKQNIKPTPEVSALAGDVARPVSKPVVELTDKRLLQAEMPDLAMVDEAKLKTPKYPKASNLGSIQAETPSGTVPVNDPIVKIQMQEALKGGERVLPESRIPSDIPLDPNKVIRPTLPGAIGKTVETSLPELTRPELEVPSRLRLANETTPGSRRLAERTGDLPSSGEVIKLPAPGVSTMDVPIDVTGNLLKHIQDAMAKRQITKGESGAVNLNILRDALNKGVGTYKDFMKSAKESGVERTVAAEAYKKYGPGIIKKPSLLSRISPRILSETDKLRNLGGIYAKIGDAVDELDLMHKRLGSGTYLNDSLKAANKLMPQQREQLHSILLTEDKTRTVNTNIPNELKPAYDTIRKQYRDFAEKEVIPRGIPTSKGVPLQVQPHAFPQMVNPAVYEEFTRRPTGEVAIRLRDDYVNFLKDKLDITSEKASEITDSIISRFGSKSRSAEFKALREAEGHGLPDSWNDFNLERVLQRYYNRAGRDVAWFDTVQKNPEIARALGEKTDPWGNAYEGTQADVTHQENVRNLLDEYLRDERFFDRTYRGPIKLAHSSLMGPVTAFRDIASTLTFGFAGLPIGKIPTAIKRLATETRKGYQTALEEGQILRSGQSRDIIFDSTASLLEKITAAANVSYKYSGKMSGELLSRSFAQVLGEFRGEILTEAAKNGNRSAIEMLREINPMGKTLTKEDLGARLASMHTGRYSMSTLPAALQKMDLLGYSLRLTRWSVEHARYFDRHVWQPMFRGDFAPMIKYMVGSYIGGEAINYILNEVNAKAKQRLPDLNELKAAGNHDMKMLAYNYATLAAMNSFAGIYGDLAKSLMDKVAGDNTSRWFQVPTLHMLTDMSGSMWNAINGILYSKDGTEATRIGLKLAADLAKSNNQMFRTAYRMLNADPEQQKKEDIRNVRAYEIATGKAAPSYGNVNINPYMNLKTSEFKKTTDLSKAKQMSKEIIAELRSKYKGPELWAAMKGLKQIPTQTMPANVPERNEYIKYEQQLGEDTNALIARYKALKRANIRKSAMIP